MELHLYWQDKNWVKRGYALNFNIVVDFDRKMFKVFENSYYGYTNIDSIEVVRKQDLKDYICYLKMKGFEEVDEF